MGKTKVVSPALDVLLDSEDLEGVGNLVGQVARDWKFALEKRDPRMELLE